MSHKRHLLQGRINFHERGTGEQVFDILSALRKGPLLSTHIMYQANLNSTLLKDLLVYMRNEGYIEYLTDYRIRLTAKGYKTLRVVTPFFLVITRIREIRREVRRRQREASQ
jgi:predicted transcriptional regulator